MTQPEATNSSRTGLLFEGWRPRVLATLGYLMMIAGLLAVTSNAFHTVTLRPTPTQAVSSPAGPVALELTNP